MAKIASVTAANKTAEAVTASVALTRDGSSKVTGRLFSRDVFQA